MRDISARELKGHNILAVERFWDNTRWMIEFSVLRPSTAWRIGKSCGFAVSGLGAGWVLDLVWRWDRRRADYVGRRTSMYPARCSS